MICTKWVYALLAAIALVLVSGWTAAEAQLAKSGTYTVYYAWHGKGERITAEKGQFVLGGTSAHGVLINKTGEGFLHQAPTDCAAGFKSVRGVAEVTGYCGSVDKDGDRTRPGAWGTDLGRPGPPQQQSVSLVLSALDHELAVFQCTLGRDQQLGHDDRLLEEGVRAELQAFDSDFRVGAGDDDGGIRIFLADLLQQLDARKAHHLRPEVDEDQRRPGLAERLEPSPPIARQPAGVARRLKHLSHDVADLCWRVLLGGHDQDVTLRQVSLGLPVGLLAMAARDEQAGALQRALSGDQQLGQMNWRA